MTPAERREKEFQNYLLESHNTMLKVGGKKINKDISDMALRAIADNSQDEPHNSKLNASNDNSQLPHALMHHLNSFKLSLSPEKYEWKECLCFWLAVHMKKFEIAQSLVSNNIAIKKLVYIATTSFIDNESEDSSQHKGNLIRKPQSETYSILNHLVAFDIKSFPSLLYSFISQ